MDLILNAATIKRLIYLILVTVITFSLAFYLSANSQSHWLIWVSLVLALINFGDTLLKRTIMIFSTGIAISITVFITGMVASSFGLLAVYLFLLILISMFLGQRYPNYTMLFFLICLFAILSATLELPLALNADRSLYILAGTFIAGFCQLMFTIHFIRDELNLVLQNVLVSLSRLTAEIFSCFLQPEYPDNIYLFERRVHVQKYNYMQAMDKLRALVNAAETKVHLAEKELLRKTVGQFEYVFDAIIDASQLRRRVSDYSVFELCSDELRAILKELERIFMQMIHLSKNKKHELETTKLASDIKRFEENYANVLQVAAREPLVFLLFISSLSGLREGLEVLYHHLQGLKKSM